MTLVHLDGATVSGVGATHTPTPLVPVRLLALTSEAEHLVLDAEALEGLTGLYIFNLVHTLRVQGVWQDCKRIGKVLTY